MIIFVTDMKNYLLAILSGILFSISWPIDGVIFFIFFAFVPLFIICENFILNEKKSVWNFFFVTYISFFFFNLITTYWVYFASPFGAIFAFLINSLLMSLVMLLFYYSRKNLTKRLAYTSLIVFWLSFEYLHLNWDLSWPWLTLGNVFSESLYMITWYKYTGVLGGSFWVIFMNILFFELYKKRNLKKTYPIVTFLFIPIIISLFLSKDDNVKSSTKLDVVIVQPNVDPYYEKFSVDYQQQLQHFISLAKTKIDSNTILLIGPETALQESIWESKVEYAESIIELKKLQLEYPKLNILLGATTYKLFDNNETKSSTARQFRNEDLWYDIYNSAIYISKNGDVSIYHKTKLVPGAEKIPFPILFNSFSSLSVDLGGVSGSLGSDNSIESFDVSSFKLLPLICYESIYGGMNSQKLFDIICIITNDGWWRNTSGYKQHFSYSKLRAIEQGKSIIRCANTGISGFISKNGDVTNIASWDEQKVVKSQVETFNTVTFYNKFGDYLGRISSFISFVFLFMIFVKSKIQ